MNKDPLLTIVYICIISGPVDRLKDREKDGCADFHVTVITEDTMGAEVRPFHLPAGLVGDGT